MKNFNCKATLTLNDNFTYGVKCLNLVSNNILAIFYRRNNLKLWNLNNFTCSKAIENVEYIQKFSYL